LAQYATLHAEKLLLFEPEFSRFLSLMNRNLNKLEGEEISSLHRD